MSTNHHNNDDNHNQLPTTTVDLSHSQPPRKIDSPPFTLPLTRTEQHNTPLGIKKQSTATRQKGSPSPRIGGLHISSMRAWAITHLTKRVEGVSTPCKKGWPPPPLQFFFSLQFYLLFFSLLSYLFVGNFIF